MSASPEATNPPALTAYDRAVNRGTDILAYLAGILLIGIAVLVTIDVLGRLPGRLGETWLFTKALPAIFGPVDANAWGITLPWTTEVTEYALYWTTFFGAPWVLKEGGHIFIDIVVQRFGPQGRLVFTRITAFFGILISAVLVYYSALVFYSAADEGTQIVRAFIIKEWIVLVPLPFCSLLLLLIFLRWLIRPETRVKGPQEAV